MSIFDDLSGLWDDANQFLAPVADFIQPIAQDLIPGFKLAQDLLGIGPQAGSTYSQQYPQLLGGASGQWDSPVMSAVQVAQGAGGVFSGGGTMDFPLTLTGGMGRGLIPYGGGMIPRGYRVVQRAAQRPTAGRPAGVYLARSRRMNPLNPRALSRAERRMSSFTRYVKRHFQTSHLMPKRKTRSRKRR